MGLLRLLLALSVLLDHAHGVGGYRFFPFELALFLAGALAYKAWAAHRLVWDQPGMRILAPIVPLSIVTWPWWAGGWNMDAFFTPPRLALLALIAAGLPAIHARSRSSAVDRAIGELSFPFYLGHLLVLGLVAGIPAVADNAAAKVGLATVLTAILAWLVVRVVEAPIEALRRRIAARATAGAQGTLTARPGHKGG